MTKRPYAMTRRAEAEAVTRERIVRATVKLHADHGPMATSYAMIAKRAQVSPQTVYNHFPDLGALLGACTGHVHARVPAVDPDTVLAGRTPAERLRRLAAAVYARHEAMAPWLRLGWYEAALIPELGAIIERGNDARRSLIAATLAPEREPSPGFVDAAFALLDYPAWKSLTREAPSADAARIAGDALADLVPRLSHPRKHPKEPS